MWHLLLSPDPLTVIIIKIPIQFIRQCDGWACFPLHNSSIIRAICDKQTRRSDSTFSQDLYFVFLLVSAENGLSHIQVVSKDNKSFCYRLVKQWAFVCNTQPKRCNSFLIKPN